MDLPRASKRLLQIINRAWESVLRFCATRCRDRKRERDGSQRVKRIQSAVWSRETRFIFRPFAFDVASRFGSLWAQASSREARDPDVRVDIVKWRAGNWQLEFPGEKRDASPQLTLWNFNYSYVCEELRAFFQPWRGLRPLNETRKDSLERCILSRAILGVDRRALSRFLEA